MTQHAGGSQSRVVMAEKEQIARRLLLRGLTIGQVAIQLRCSRAFVTKVKKDLGSRAYQRSDDWTDALENKL